MLLIGILKIKKLINEYGYQRMVNHRAFTLHFTIFSIYIAALLLVFFKMVQFFLEMNKPDRDPSHDFLKYEDVQIVATLAMFLFQLMLFWILWRMNISSYIPIAPNPQVPILRTDSKDSRNNNRDSVPRLDRLDNDVPRSDSNYSELKTIDNEDRTISADS